MENNVTKFTDSEMESIALLQSKYQQKINYLIFNWTFNSLRLKK